jgi:hypothetical protein
MRLGFRDMLIALLVIGVLVGVVFGGGVIYGRNSVPPATPIAAAGGAAGAATGAAGSGAAGAGTTGGGGTPNVLAGQTIGVIQGIQGDAITVRALNGQTTTLAASLSTRVTNTVPGNVNDLKAGQLVAITPGPPDAQGRTIATSVLILPPGLATTVAAVGLPATGTPRPNATGTPSP